MSKDEIRIITKNGEIITADSPIWRWEISEKIGHSGVNLEDPNVTEVEKEKFVKSIHDIAISYNIEPDELLKAVKIVAKESQHVPWFGCSPSRHAVFAKISQAILLKEQEEEALKFFNEGKYFDAVKSYHKLIQINPNEKSYHIGFIKSQMNRKEYIQALCACADALEIHKDDSEIKSLYAEISESIGDQNVTKTQLDSAISNYENAIYHKPGDVNIRLKLIDALIKNKEHSKAFTEVNNAIKLDLNNSKAKEFKTELEAIFLYESAIKKYNSKDYDGTIKDYEQSQILIKFHDNNLRMKAQQFAAESFKILGDKLFEAKDYEVALAYYAKALSLNSHYSYYSKKAHALIELSRFEEAELAAEESFKIHTTFDYEAAKSAKATVMNNIGVEYSKAGKNEEALNYYNEAIILAKHSQHHANKANTLVKLKRYEEAKVAAEQALKINPSNEYAKKRLAEAQKEIVKAEYSSMTDEMWDDYTHKNLDEKEVDILGQTE